MRMLDERNERRAAASVNDLIRPQEYRLRDRQPERLGGLSIDDQLELRRLLHREVSRVRPFQDLVHINGGAAIEICSVRAVAQEASSLDVFSRSKHGRQLVR